jgi:murein tripeptide amidase MpaA
MLVAAIHAREWVSTSTVTYIINELVTKSSDYADLLSTLDFYIVPIINPDGYVYTHTTDRMWRKTRSDHSSAFGCRGVDANRNFGFHWGEAGSSSDKCSETYRGPNAYSEPEAEAIKNFIESVREEVDWGVYITLHSYSQVRRDLIAKDFSILPRKYVFDNL